MFAPLFNLVSYLAIAVVSALLFVPNHTNAQGLALPSGSSPRVLVIVDIDDTLKDAGASQLNLDTLRKAFTRANSFVGMSYLLEFLIHTLPVQEGFFHYVTTAPAFPMERFHRKFIQEGSFPEAPMHFRSTADLILRVRHKHNTIRGLILSNQPDVVIMIGDNGEKDPIIFRTIAGSKEFSHIRFLEFIRITYLKRGIHNWYPEQVGFISPLEIIDTLLEEGLIPEASREQSEKFIELLKKLIRIEGVRLFHQSKADGILRAGKHPVEKLTEFFAELEESFPRTIKWLHSLKLEAGIEHLKQAHEQRLLPGSSKLRKASRCADLF